MRIACLKPDARLWKHQDYVELDDGRKRLRLHIPLTTNPEALIQFSKHAVNMAASWLWKLNPTVNHAASQTGSEPRIHLVLDCYVDEALRRLQASEVLEQTHVREPPRISAQNRKDLLDRAQGLLEDEGIKNAEQLLMKSFHQYDLGDETSYDLLIDLYHNEGYNSREVYWIREKISRIYDRGKLDPSSAITDIRGILNSRLSGTVGELPQCKLLQEVLHKCRQSYGLEQVYVRGSLARGDADAHSDIDLLCVVAPQHFVSILEHVRIDISQQFKPAADAWVDNIVPDFGGIGLVYLLDINAKCYQLDLYVACQGYPSLERLDRLPHKQEIFRKAGGEGHNKRQDTLRYRLHADIIEQQTMQMRSTIQSVSQTIIELCLLAYMLNKCTKRGDDFVAADRFHMWKSCFIKLIRHRFDEKHIDYGFYHVKRLETEAGDEGKLYKDLCAMNNHSLTAKDLVNMHRYATEFELKHFPGEYTKLQKLIQAVTRHLENSNGMEGLSPQALSTPRLQPS